MQRLQILTTQFEQLMMEETESIGDFNSRLCDISNECFALGERLTEEKLVRKVLRSLPKIFDHKVTAIEEAKDISSMRLDELIGSLITFEMRIKGDEAGKRKKIAFTAETVVTGNNSVQQKEFLHSVAMITKTFGRAMKRMNKRFNHGSTYNRD